MPPLPLNIFRITIPSLGYVVVDKSCEAMRMASLAIFTDICADDQYHNTINRKSAITALCMFDKDDVADARVSPGDFPNIDLLQRVFSEGLSLEVKVEEMELRR